MARRQSQRALAPQDRITVRGKAAGQAYPYEEGAMRAQKRRVLILGIVFACCALLFTVLPTGVAHDPEHFTLPVILSTTASNFGSLIEVFAGNPHYYELRLMNTVVCLVSGAALGLCGSTYQGAFNNPLAAPKTLGVMSGGALGALIYILFFRNMIPQMPLGYKNDLMTQIAWYHSLTPLERFLTEYGSCLCSIVGCFCIVGVVMFIAGLAGRGKLSNITVIIAGQVFSVAATAIIQFCRYYFTMAGDEELSNLVAEIETYSMVSSYTYEDLGIVVAPILACIIVILCMRNRLTLLSFGDEEAYSMGLNVNRTRYFTIAICTLMVALAISFCGHVAFLGFISAHISRKIVGPDFRYLLPASAFTGGAFLLIIQYICYSGLPFTYENAAASVCSVLGSFIFLILAVREGRKGADAWSK